LEGVEGARVAARIFRGEPASSIPPLVIGTREPMYDWRELRRWGISESRLPPGSVVLFRQPTTWERYRWQIVGAAAVIATQAVLIFALFVQLRRRRVAEAARRLAEAETHQRRAELAHMSRVATLGELTATLAHEVSQPLTAIISNAAAGQQFLEAPDLDRAELRDTLADISADTERASEVVRRLRSMLKRGKPAEFAPLDLNDVIRSVDRLVRGDGARHRVTIELHLAPDLPDAVGDRVQLEQVVMNLMLNAFAAMDQPKCRTRRLLVRTARAADGQHVEAEFRDTGVGIATDVIDRLFEPFVTTKPDGLGMGLSICRSILDQHGGELRAANHPAGGATFSFTLPVARTSRRGSPASGASRPAPTPA
jgi:C4-dicarboxylate-specific signal transduction histidine kinase